MEKQSQAPEHAKQLDAVLNDSQEQILVLNETELQQISGGRGPLLPLLGVILAE
jgi:bacteriocin-like protein